MSENKNERLPMGAAELPDEQEPKCVCLELPEAEEKQEEQSREEPRTFLLNTVPNSGNTTNNPDNNIVPIGNNHSMDHSR